MRVPFIRIVNWNLLEKGLTFHWPLKFAPIRRGFVQVRKRKRKVRLKNGNIGWNEINKHGRQRKGVKALGV